MSTLFISHSSRDNAAAEELRDELEKQGHRSVFLDLDPEKGIQAGASWERTLYTKLRACRAVVALCSENYLASQWCFAEIALARMEGKELFALQIDPWSEETRLPSILTEKQYIDLRTDKDAGYQRLWNGFKVKGIVPEEHREWRPEDPPYPGLRAFDEKDAPIFFGRDQELQDGVELLNRVRRQGHPRVVMVLGSSGSGKSSLARAGILPRLRRDAGQWLVVGPFRPGRRPARNLAFALAAAFEQAGQALSWEQIYPQLEPAAEPADGEADEGERQARRRLLEALAAFERELDAGDRRVAASVRHLRDSLESPAGSSAGPGPAPGAAGAAPLAELAARLRGSSEASVVLVVDQFEELMGHDDEGPSHPANRFLGLLRDGVEADDDPCLVLGTMRSDYLGMLQRSRPLQGVGFKTLSVGPMSRDGMRQVIERPATLGQIQLEGLTERLLDDTGTSDALPLLAFTLRTMWDRYHETRVLDVRAYEELGGLQGAIAQVADDTLEAALELGDKDRQGNERDLRDAFLSLARPTEEGSGWARQPVSWDKLPEAVRPMLQHFVDNRLLLMRQDGSVEVAHEALFRSWETLRGWLSANSEALHLRREIQVEAAKWEKAEAEDRKEYRWRGGRLARALELRAGGVLALGELESGFIGDSHRAERAAIEAEAARQRRELRRARVFAAVVGAAFLVALVLFFYALEKRNRAQDQTRIAVASKLLERDPTRAALVLLELGKPAETPQAVQLLSDALAEPLAVVVLGDHPGAVTSADFDRTGERILTVSGDTVRIWHADGIPLLTEDGRRVELRHEELGVERDPSEPSQEVQVNSAAFSPGDGRIVTGSKDGTVRLWNADGAPVPIGDDNAFVPRHEGEVYSVAWDSAGVRILSASEDKTVRVWTADGTPAPRADGSGDLVLDHSPWVQPSRAVFAPGGERILTACNDGTSRVWDLDGRELLRVEKPGSPMFSAAFSPAGRRIATGAADGTVRLWKLENGALAGLPFAMRHDAEVLGVAFWGDHIVTACNDGTARVWNAADGSPVPMANGRPVVLRHLGGVNRAVVSPGGDRILTASKDGTARLWSTDWGGAGRGEPLALWAAGNPRRVRSAAVSPGDGERILTAWDDGTVQLWDTESGAPFAPPAGSSAQTDAARKSVWSADGSGWPLELDGHQEIVLGAAVSPRGDTIVTFSEDGTARLWRADGTAVSSEAEPVVLRPEDGGKLLSAAFSLTGDKIVTATSKGNAQVWEAGGRPVSRDGEPVVLRHGKPTESSPDLPIFSAAFSPDGHRIVTASSEDTTARVWNADGSPIRSSERGFLELRNPGKVLSAAFSPEGDRIATASDFDIFVWNADASQRIGPFRGHQSDVLTVAFSPEGDRLVTGSRDKTARIWSADREGEPLLVLRGHRKKVVGAVFGPDGERVVTASPERAARVWRVTYDSLGAHLRRVITGVCLAPAFREKNLNESPGTSEKRYQRCTRCLGTFRRRLSDEGLEKAFRDYRDCTLPVLH